MMTILFSGLQILIGFSSGIIIGGAFIALLTVLGIIPRLIHVSKSWQLVHVYRVALILGTLFGTFLSFTSMSWSQPTFTLAIWGIIHGVFNGMLAAALIEILQVFPLLSKRLGLEAYILFLLTAIVLGKVIGSLYQWLFLMKGT